MDRVNKVCGIEYPWINSEGSNQQLSPTESILFLIWVVWPEDWGLFMVYRPYFL